MFESGGRRPHQLEDLAALYLCATAARRAAHRAELDRLLARVDPERLAAVLAGQRVLALAGGRAVAWSPRCLGEHFLTCVDAARQSNRRAAIAVELHTLRVLSRLQVAGIAAVPLKGPRMAATLHGEVEARSCFDVDLLVAPEHLEEAVRVAVSDGYGRPHEWGRLRDRPKLHYRLEHPGGLLPPLELHWRIDWYGAAFSGHLLERARGQPIEGRQVDGAEQLAALLVFYARDGFQGLRLAADIAGWWDRFGDAGLDGVLDPLAAAFPSIAHVLDAASGVCQRLVGVPARALRAGGVPRRRRTLVAQRLVNWRLRGSTDQLQADVTLVDWLLVPPGGQRAYAQRWLWPEPYVIRRSHELPPDSRSRMFVHRLTFGPKLMCRHLYALWRVRLGRLGTGAAADVRLRAGGGACACAPGGRPGGCAEGA